MATNNCKAITPESKEEFAAALRAAPTQSEKLLLDTIQANFPHYDFTSNPVVLGFIPDIYSDVLKLIVEVDGSSHYGREFEDRKRDSIFFNKGIITIRVSARSVLTDLPEVMSGLKAAIKERGKRLGLQLQQFKPLILPVPVAKVGVNTLQPPARLSTKKTYQIGEPCPQCKSPLSLKDRNGKAPSQKGDSTYYYDKYIKCSKRGCGFVQMRHEHIKYFADQSPMPMVGPVPSLKRPVPTIGSPCPKCGTPLILSPKLNKIGEHLLKCEHMNPTGIRKKKWKQCPYSHVLEIGVSD